MGVRRGGGGIRQLESKWRGWVNGLGGFDCVEVLSSGLEDGL